MKLKQLLLVGISEAIVSLALISTAPTFLNSKKPGFGFAIWFAVPTMLASSSIYAARKLTAAKSARNIFVTAFPEYGDVSVEKFLDLSPAYVADQIDLLAALKDNSDIQELNISLFEILEQTNEKT